MTEHVAEPTEVSSLMHFRAQTYGFLSRIFRVEVDQAFLDEMCAMEFPASTGNDQIDEGYRLLSAYRDTIQDESMDELAVDYVRTFVGHGVDSFSAAYPFESVHTSERRLLMQEARDEVLAIYRANDLKRSETWNEGEDHIALELEFMQIMANRTAEALDAGNESAARELLVTQSDFLKQHMLNWIPLLVAALETFARTDFYQGAGKLLLGFIKTDEELVCDLLESDA